MIHLVTSSWFCCHHSSLLSPLSLTSPSISSHFIPYHLTIVSQRAVTAGYYTLPEATPDTPARQLLRTHQLSCNPGSYCVQGKKYPCPAGFYGNTSFLVNVTCTAVCPEGSYCPEGASEPILCPAGTPSLSPPRFNYHPPTPHYKSPHS